MSERAPVLSYDSDESDYDSTTAPVYEHSISPGADIQESYRPPKISEIGSLQAKTYCIDRAISNFAIIKEKDPKLAGYYSELMRSNPELRMVDIQKNTSNDGRASFNTLYFARDRNSEYQYRPAVIFNLDNPRTYLPESNNVRKQGMEFLLRQVAVKVGAKEEDVLRNLGLCKTFVFMHEFGHAHHYLNNYLLPEQKKGGPITAALKSAETRYQKDSLVDLMKMPIPRAINNEDVVDLFKTFRKRLEAMDIYSPQELDIRLHRDYREQKTEKHADDFAEQFIMSHYDDFFLRPGATGNVPGKIKTGERILMKDDFASLLGINPGSNISLEVIAGNCSPQTAMRYRQQLYVRRRLGINQPIVLGDGDPHNTPSFATPVVRSVCRQRDASGRNKILLYCDDGTVLRMRKNNIEPPVFQSSADIMTRNLRIDKGSEVQLLIKQTPESGSGLSSDGSMVTGILQNSIRIGDNVTLRNSRGITTTSPIASIRRRWKTYLLTTTRGSTYEVIPYK